MNTLNLYDSVEEMLAPSALRALTGLDIAKVARQPLAIAHRSGNELEAVEIESRVGRSRLILKEFQPARDWVMRLTHDGRTREAMLYARGIYARMPEEIHVPVIAAAKKGETWATLMEDVAASLLPTNEVLSTEGAWLLIQHLAELHTHFWKDNSLADERLGLSSLEDFVTILEPTRVQQEIAAGRGHPVLELAAKGWNQFAAQAPAEVVEIVREWQSDPSPLLEALEAMPPTLVHGDYKPANLGITPGRQTIVLDWQDAAQGPGVLDLGYFLALNARWLPFSKEEAIQVYWNALMSHGKFISTHELELGLVAGGALRLLWLMVATAQNDLEWWYDLIRRTAENEYG